jgi:hypothetical protein
MRETREKREEREGKELRAERECSPREQLDAQTSVPTRTQ